MRCSDVRLRIYLFLTGVILIAGSVSGGPPELPREQYLARGCFQLAVFNRDETRLLTTIGEIAQLWDLRTGTVIQQFEGHEATIHSVCFSRDEQQILTGAGKTGEHGRDDATVRLWDVTGKPVAVFGHPLPDENGPSISGAMISARFSPDEKQVVFSRPSGAGRDLWVRDLSRGTETRFTNDRSINLQPVWSPKGDRIAFSSNRKGGAFNLSSKAASGSRVASESSMAQPTQQRLWQSSPS